MFPCLSLFCLPAVMLPGGGGGGVSEEGGGAVCGRSLRASGLFFRKTRLFRDFSRLSFTYLDDSLKLCKLFR